MPSEQPHPHPRRILVLEAEGPFQRRLVADLEAAGPYVVRVARTAREACQILLSQPHDLALIPLADSRAVMAGLRAVQPDLPLVLLADEAELAVGQTVPETAQALLLRSCMQTELPVALQQALTASQEAANDHGRPRDFSRLSFEMATANQLLRELEWPEAIKAALLLDQGQPVAEWGRMDLETMEVILDQLEGAHLLLESSGSAAQVQFIELGGQEKRLPHLLYSQPFERPVAAGLLLALVALPPTTIADLRHQAAIVAGRLHDLISEPVVTLRSMMGRLPVVAPPAVAANDGSKTYALVWRAAVHLSKSLQALTVLQMEKLAQANGCLLRHSLVRSDLVHVIVTCPPGRNAAWAIHLFKHGLLQKMPNQMEPRAGTTRAEPAVVWAKGHYATEAYQPLSDAELNLFLERNS
jgi:CheY-like chemotaxis protein